MSSSPEADYAAIKVFLSPGATTPGSNGVWVSPATPQNFTSVPTDHPHLALAVHRLHPPHPHVRSRFLLLNVSPHQSLKLDVFLTLDIQFAERDVQGTDSGTPRECVRRFRNSSHVLYCRGIRVKPSPPVSNHLYRIWAFDTHRHNMIPYLRNYLP